MKAKQRGSARARRNLDLGVRPFSKGLLRGSAPSRRSDTGLRPLWGYVSFSKGLLRGSACEAGIHGGVILGYAHFGVFNKLFISQTK
jgi:hypothetical protein